MTAARLDRTNVQLQWDPSGVYAVKENACSAYVILSEYVMEKNAIRSGRVKKKKRLAIAYAPVQNLDFCLLHP